MLPVERVSIERRFTGAVTHDLDRTLARLRSEYREMPGLSLTVAQATRLFSLTECECHSALECLVTEGFLRRTHRLTYRLPEQV